MRDHSETKINSFNLERTTWGSLKVGQFFVFDIQFWGENATFGGENSAFRTLLYTIYHVQLKTDKKNFRPTHCVVFANNHSYAPQNMSINNCRISLQAFFWTFFRKYWTKFRKTEVIFGHFWPKFSKILRISEKLRSTSKNLP